jgi:hypothetical protein
MNLVRNGTWYVLIDFLLGCTNAMDTAVGVGNELDMNLKKLVRILANKMNRRKEQS